MKTSLIRTAAVMLLGSTALLSQAATVKLDSWAFGSGNKVTVGTPNHTGFAGGFKGSVSFAPGGESGFSVDLSDFITYCIEIDESFNLPSGPMESYSVVAGGAYSKWNNANGSGNTASGTAGRLGQLLGYVGSDVTLVDSAAKSTSLQLAIWNVIYDNDALLGTGLFKETLTGNYNGYAKTLLDDSATYASALDVYVLKRDGKQDFILTTSPSLPPQQDVPEPASLALSLLGLAAAGAVSRRRRQRV